MALRAAAPLIAFVQLGRPLFLLGGLVFHALGVAMALYQGRPLNIMALILGQAAITAAQLMTHYSNDYFDLPHDRANHNATPWSGGSRVLPDGRLQPRVALTAALAFMAIALGAALALALVARPPLLAIVFLLAGTALAWFYSAPPLRLAARGWGEITPAVVVPGFTTLAGLLMQGGSIGPTALLAILPLVGLQFAMLLAVEFPDAEPDEQTGKRTLVVRLGGERAAMLHSVALMVGAMALLVGLIAIGSHGDVLLAAALLAIWLFTLPVEMWHGSRVMLGAWCDPLQWSSIAFWGIALLIGTAALETAAFTWGAVQRGAKLPFS